MTSYKELFDKKCVDYDVLIMNLQVLHVNLVDSVNYLNIDNISSKIKNQLRKMKEILNK